MIFLHWLVLIISLAHANEFTISFTDSTQVESTTLVYNQELNVIHSTLRTIDYTATSPPPLEFSVGNGEHGAFEPSTYANFSVGGDVSGNKIRLDTDTYPSLNVTRFELAQGWRLEPLGSQSLIIRSQSDVIIEGELWCQGDAGQDAVGATAGLGGVGRCGGKNGGDGGALSSPGTSGEDSNGIITGGRAGNFTGGAAVGGGGGGAFNSFGPGNGPNVNGGGGQAGNSVADPMFTLVLGSAGGGGGSGTAGQAGAGGGAGGGIVQIYAVRDLVLGRSPSSVFGSINVSGGKGGDSNVPGGPGGGGGGGSIQVFVGRNIEIFNSDGSGASQANRGVAGTNSLAATGAVGGLGRSWFSSVGYNLSGAVGFYTPAEEAPITPPGLVVFSTQAQDLVTKSFTLPVSKPKITSIESTPVTNEFSYEVSGSDDDFVSDDSGWVTDLSLIENKKYYKIKITLQTSLANQTNPPMISGIQVNYDANPIEEYDFIAVGCGSIGVSQPPGSAPWFLLIMPLLLIFVLYQKERPSEIDVFK